MANKTRETKIKELTRYAAEPEKYKVIKPETPFGQVLICEDGKGVIRAYTQKNYKSLSSQVKPEEVEAERLKLTENAS